MRRTRGRKRPIVRFRDAHAVSSRTRARRDVRRDEPDRKSPTDTGNEPGSGALIAAVEYAAERGPDVVAGKPNDPIIEVSLDHFDVDASECLVIGDNPETDIRMGTRAGMTTVLVLTGLIDRTDPAATNGVADHVLESLGEIDEVLASESTTNP
ncbi:hypothetical protein D8S78_05765 [Natrialba swarupiae]|nr:hypothetical protein [Natrialba swarupiae]